MNILSNLQRNAHGDCKQVKATGTATDAGTLIYGFIIKGLAGGTVSYKDRDGTAFTDEFYPPGVYVMTVSEFSSSDDVMLLLLDPDSSVKLS